MINFERGRGWYKNSFGESVGGSQSGRIPQHIAPRPAGPYPDISLAGKNPMSVALTERHHKSQDNYLLGKIEARWVACVCVWGAAAPSQQLSHTRMYLLAFRTFLTSEFNSTGFLNSDRICTSLSENFELRVRESLTQANSELAEVTLDELSGTFNSLSGAFELRVRQSLTQANSDLAEVPTFSARTREFASDHTRKQVSSSQRFQLSRSISLSFSYAVRIE